MKSNTILLLVILFFVLGCTFSCDGIKEYFDDGGLKSFSDACKYCFVSEILKRGQEICKADDSKFNGIMDEIFYQGPKEGSCNLAFIGSKAQEYSDWICNRTGGCLEQCHLNPGVLEQIKKTKNKTYLINLVNKECAR